MSKLEVLIKHAYDEGLDVYEDIEFNSSVNGLIVDKTIALSNVLDKESEKLCVLAEEIGHYNINEGNIILDPYQEKKAHRYAIDLLLSVEKVINATIELGEDATLITLANKLEVTERFLKESLELYSKRFPGVMEYKQYKISFNPYHVWIEE